MRRNNDFKIDFIGIGAPKSGTTWVAQCLKEHPQICLSDPKELNFFNKKYVFYRKNESWKYQYGMDWYKKHFCHCLSDQLRGEFSVYYLYDPETPRLISLHFPNVKLIVVLRNPVDRLYSHYLHARAKIKLPPFEEIIKKEKEFVSQGFYYKHLQNYLKYFPRKNLLIVIYEDIEKNPRDFIQRIYEFLGINKDFIPPSLYTRINPTAPKLFFVRRLFFKTSKRLLNNKTGKLFVEILKVFKIDKAIKKWCFVISQRLSYRRLDLKTRKNLMKLYKDDIKKLEDLIYRKLDLWR